MAYSVTVYKNSGFNSGNIPDTPALLEQCTKLNALPTLEILQDSGLDEIYIKATLSEITGADYVKVGSWYYTVNGEPRMTSPDVVRLSLTPDYVTSAGGAGSLSYTDGVTERVCVPVSSDTFGAYTEADPLTAPSQTLELRTEQLSYSSTSRVFVEATVDLINGATTNNAQTYEDPVSGETCTVPYMPTTGVETLHRFGGKRGTTTYTPTSSNDVMDSIKRARGLGMESAIIAQYSVPEVFIQTPESGVYGVLDGKDNTATLSTLPFEQASVKNRRALYGEYTKYGILTMGGNRGEFKAEDIYQSGASNPSVSEKSDIRAEGCPYWRFTSYLGDSSDAGFWRNCLAGAPWQNVPLIYSEKSGSILDRQMFDADRRYAVRDLERETGEAVGGSIGNALGTAVSGLASGGIVGLAGGSILGTASVVSDMFAMNKRLDKFRTDSERSRYEFKMGQITAPELNFPFNTDIMRDALGNAIIAYRYYYTSSDLARIDKLLTMYGYRYTKALEASDFTNRPKFNYVRTQGGVTSTSNAGGRLPKWWNDGISAQLSAGVRVWHILPTVSAYSDNT